MIEKVEIFADKEKTDFHIVSTLESVSDNLVAATALIVHIREHLPILLGTRVTALREPQKRKATM